MAVLGIKFANTNNVVFWSVFLFLALFLSSSLDISALSHNLHHLCLEKLSFQSSLANIYKSLVCGKRLPAGQLKELFIQGGLIHLTVVSGAHLLFLERVWQKIPLPLFFKTHGLFVVLILYSLASHLYPPVLRALFSFFLFRLSQSFKLFWNPCFITLLSGWLCLVYQPAWVYSFSLQLSLLACFLQNISTSTIKKCFFTYLFILPIVNRWQALHPFTVLINWTLAPLISGLLFPLSFLSPFFSFLYPLTDTLWAVVFKALKAVQLLPSQSPLMKWFLPKEWIWPYIGLVCCILFIVHFFERKHRLYSKK